jgi:hypothetical protein
MAKVYSRTELDRLNTKSLREIGVKLNLNVKNCSKDDLANTIYEAQRVSLFLFVSLQDPIG